MGRHLAAGRLASALMKVKIAPALLEIARRLI
jgi:hypothetical protein